MSFAGNNIGIDLGTSNTLVYVNKKGVIINEPSVVAINTNNNEVKAIGMDAKEMQGKTPYNIETIRPLRDGVIADFNVAKVLIKYFIDKALNNNKFARPKICICVPVGVTSIERKAVEDIAQNAGARVIQLVEEPKAAAIGAGIDVAAAIGNMVVDIGGGTTEIAVISLGGIVVSDSLRLAGDKIDIEVKEYVKRKYKLDIGIKSAEIIKTKLGNACEEYYTTNIEGIDNSEKITTINTTGIDMVTGLPRTIELTAEEIRESMSETINNIVSGVKRCLERTPPELSSDIYCNGIYLTGGGALIKGLDLFMQKETGLIVRVAESPLECVALGAGKICEDM
ncbi:rod shape-determining protein [Sedimentibacter sp. zth1]|uniref:rod shape-determining protein n=1 Tax=Sedimentibacter sp. zth1 TaxID=2816908 RepID=UPI0027381C96|nr:rod shape-determining protein [Sedimentibacter sp. zth1]